mmetsp:Transcript_36008/g.95074  ORF Transcript_36008/g.95074 Transcript_36008/m.95074 type:complete len:273 (-) Transcript_36008:196-1014(-)
MRAEEKDDVAVLGDVVGEGFEAGLANKGRAADAAEREARAPVLLEQIRQVTLLVVDLIWADRRANDRVDRGKAEGLGFQDRTHACVDSSAGECTWEVLVQRRVARRVQLRRPAQPGEDHVLHQEGALQELLAAFGGPREGVRVLASLHVRLLVLRPWAAAAEGCLWDSHVPLLHKIHVGLPVSPHLEHERHEVVLVWGWHVDLDAAHEHQGPGAEVRVHYLQRLRPHGLIGLVSQCSHRILLLLDEAHMRLELGLDPSHLHVALVELVVTVI